MDDDLYMVFREKLYYAGFLQRREYIGSDGSKVSRIKREWVRYYVELKGPFLNCWKAGSCDTDPASISRLKQEAATGIPNVELPPMDMRMIVLEELEDFRVDQSIHNAFSINYSEGLNKVHFMTCNSTILKEWKVNILRSSKEALLLDQRYTVSLITSPGAPSFSENTLPNPATIKVKWPGTINWTSITLNVEAKKGFKNTKIYGNKPKKCIYLYENTKCKKCLARLTDITGIYAVGGREAGGAGGNDEQEEGHFDFIVEASGKLKSSKLGGLKKTSRAWFRVSRMDLQVKWISILRNCFELSTSSIILASTGMENSNNSAGGISKSSTSNLSDFSMTSNQNGSSKICSTIIDNGLHGPSRKPWERKKSSPSEGGGGGGDPLGTFPNTSVSSASPCQGHFNYENFSSRDESQLVALMIANQRREEDKRRRQYELANSHGFSNRANFFNCYTIPPFIPPMPMPIPMPMSMQMPMPMMFPPPPTPQSYNMGPSPKMTGDLPIRSNNNHHRTDFTTFPQLLPQLYHSNSYHGFGQLDSEKFHDDHHHERVYNSNCPGGSTTNNPLKNPTTAVPSPTRGDATMSNPPLLSNLSLGAEPSTTKSSRRYFLPLLETIITPQPYNSVSCAQLYGTYERACQQKKLPIATPSEVKGWMRELGYTLKVSTLNGGEESLFWYHIALKS